MGTPKLPKKVAVTPKYGSKELVACVLQLGFTIRRKQSGTSHIKYDPPKTTQVAAGQRSYIMIQMGIKTYDKNACSRYISELKAFGFTREQILECL